MALYVYPGPFNGGNVDLANSLVTGDVLTADGDGTYSFQPGGAGGAVASVVAGTGISVNSADPANPIVTNTGVRTVTAGTNITLGGTATDPIVNASGALGVASVSAGDATVTIGGTATNPTVAVTGSTFQPLDSDLTTIAGLTATSDNFIQSKSSAWASRTPLQVATDLAGQTPFTAAFQALDADLTTIAGLTATTDNFMQSKASAWSSRTPTQVATDLAGLSPFTGAYQPLDSDLTTIAGLTATTDSFIQSKASAWASRTLAQVQTDIAAVPLSTVTTVGDFIVASGASTVTRIAAGATMTTLQGAGAGVTPVYRANARFITTALTDGATPALDASLGKLFTLLAAGDRVIAVPTNQAAGMSIIIAHTASGANRTLALNTGANGFAFGTDITALTITTSALTDYIGCIWNATLSKWLVISYVKGY